MKSLILFSSESFSIKHLCSMAGLAKPVLSVFVHSGYLFESSGVEVHSMRWEGRAFRYVWQPVETIHGQISCEKPSKFSNELQKKVRLFGLSFFCK